MKQFRQKNVNLPKEYSIIGGFSGSRENVPFTKRSLCNLCGKINSDQVDDDVKKMMDVFVEIELKIHTSHTGSKRTVMVASRI